MIDNYKLNKKLIYFGIFCILATILLTRLWPIIQYGETGLGYDVGFYRRYLQLPQTSFPRPETALLGKESIGTRVFLDIFTKIGFNPNAILYGIYLLLHLSLGLLIYLLTKKIFNKKSALVALLIFALSPAQFLAFWYAFFKQIIALNWLFLTMLAIESQSLWFLMMLGLTLISHRTTAFISSFSLIPFGMWQFIKSKNKYIIGLGLLLITLLIWLTNKETISQLISLINNGFTDEDIYSLKTGQFMSLSEYIGSALLYILPALYGIYLALKRKKINILLFFTLVIFILILFKSFFYYRLIIFLDLGLLIYAGFGLINLYEKLHSFKWIKMASIGWIILLLLNQIAFIKNQPPIIMPAELAEIKTLNNAPNESYLITYTSKFSPWIYGWTRPELRVISPGLLWDKWSLPEWQKFWDGSIDTQKQMLASYQSPIYIFDPQRDDYQTDKCFKRLGKLVWEFKCY